VQVLARINRPAPGKGQPPLQGTQAAAAAAAAACESMSAMQQQQQQQLMGECKQEVLQGAAAPEVLPSGFTPVVIDFVNSASSIRDSFAEYYDVTTYISGAGRAWGARLI
jgi:hypothetical protein